MTEPIGLSPRSEAKGDALLSYWQKSYHRGRSKLFVLWGSVTVLQPIFSL